MPTGEAGSAHAPTIQLIGVWEVGAALQGKTVVVVGQGVGLRVLSRFRLDLRALESLLPAAIRPDWQPLTGHGH